MHDDRTKLLDRARQAVERGDHAEAHALAAIALADADDELAAWAGYLELKLESIDHSLSEVTKALGDLGGWAEQINAGLGVLSWDQKRP